MSIWSSVLQRHVTKGAQFGVPIHVVNYGGISKDPDFKCFIEALATADTASLSRNESFALGINAYNAFAVKTLIDFACRYEDNEQRSGKCLGPAYGLPDVRIGSFGSFTKKMHNLSGTLYSLNDIEGMMRPVPSAPLFRPPIDTTEDLRIHGCLVCDGTSCPNLALSAFEAESVDAQMDAACADWMANPWKGLRINTTSNTVHLSKIMSWFAPEFSAQGGAIKAYHRFFPAEAQAYFATAPRFTLEYMGYIWDANGPVPCSCTPSPVAATTTEASCHIKRDAVARRGAAGSTAEHVIYH